MLKKVMAKDLGMGPSPKHVIMSGHHNQRMTFSGFENGVAERYVLTTIRIDMCNGAGMPNGKQSE